MGQGTGNNVYEHEETSLNKMLERRGLVSEAHVEKDEVVPSGY